MTPDDSVVELLTKGVAETFPNRQFIESLLRSGRQLTVYAGFDPTGPALHLGHAIGLRKLRQFQDLGHKVIFLIGDFTAMIGDPTDKLAARTQLTKAEVKRNLKSYKKQASRLIRFSGKNKAIVKFNSSWLKKMKFSDVTSLASLITVDQLLKRDMFEKRTQEGKPIFLHEFLYPLMQGYDSVAMKVDGEIGGSDQMFNMLAGRTLEQKMLHKEKFVLTLKLLEDSSGKKMSKTEGNMVTLDDAPEEMYGKVMSWADSLVPVALELCTDLSMSQIKELVEKTQHPKELKMRLAFEIVKSVWGVDMARQGEQHFVQLFQKGEMPENISSFPKEAITLEDFLIREKFIASKSELRRLVSGGGLYQIHSNRRLEASDLKEPLVEGTYKVGKKTFFKII